MWGMIFYMPHIFVNRLTPFLLSIFLYVEFILLDKWHACLFAFLAHVFWPD